jgi:hypothetical protein
MKAYRGMDIYTLIHIFCTSTLVGGEWSASRADRFTPWEVSPDIHWKGGWVDPRSCLDDVEKWKFLPPPGLELWPVGRPVRSQSLYRLRYPVCILYSFLKKKSVYNVKPTKVKSDWEILVQNYAAILCTLYQLKTLRILRTTRYLLRLWNNISNNSHFWIRDVYFL